MARNWVHTISRCSWTFKIFASECRWCTADDRWQPVAMRSAEFWTVWSLLMEEVLALGAQIGAP